MTMIFATVVAFLLAGASKGAFELGLPSADIAFMTLVIRPRAAIASILFPMLTTNLWQIYRSGYFVCTIRIYWLFAVNLFLGGYDNIYNQKHTCRR